MIGKILRNFGIFLAALTLVLWLSLGAHRGWTKTTVPVVKVDPITEIEYPEYEKKFVPGLDFLAVGLAAAFALTLSGLVLAKLPSRNPKNL